MSRLFGVAAALAATAILAFAGSAQAGIFGSSEPTTPLALARKLHQPVSPKLMATLGKASRVGLDLATKPVNAKLKVISGPDLNTGHKVGLLYIGADFCPYCAAQRWGLMLVLSRFGKLDGLRYMLSSPSDAFANTATVTFQHAKYQSKYVALQAVETTNRFRHRLMTPDKLQQKIFLKFDAPPYVRYTESIPFVYLDGHYMLKQLMVSPKQINGKNWQQIAHALANPHSKLFKNVMPKVNLMTAAICHLDGGKPADVCTSPGVKAANSVLLTLHPTQH